MRLSSDHDPLDLVERDLVVTSIVKTRRARAFVVRHLPGNEVGR